MKLPFLDVGKLGPNDFFRFPTPTPDTICERNGLIAIGGNLSPGVLLSAYKQGVFPWYSEPPIRWYSPDPRFVLFFQNIRPSESMRRLLRKKPFRFTCDHAFDKVIRACSQVHQQLDRGTWITNDMIEAYENLHQLGYAHSIETWQDGNLVGGLYGVSIGRMFFGESMFHTVSNASKAAFFALVNQLKERDFALIDSQVVNPHMMSLGGANIPRSIYLQLLQVYVFLDPPSTPWKAEIDPELPYLEQAHRL